MAELATLARPYAKAAFDYAQEANQLDLWSQQLSILGAVSQDRDFITYLERPELTKAQQVQALVTASGQTIGTPVLNFLTQLAENNRLTLLPAITAEYESLKAQGTNTTDVQIESAFDLNPEQVQILTARLEQRFGTKVSTTITVNPALIAGVIIRAGDQVIDDSALGKLEQMRTRLLAN